MCSRSKPSDSVTSDIWTCRNTALRFSSETFDASHSPYSLIATSLNPGIFNGLISFGPAEPTVEAVTSTPAEWDGSTLILIGGYGAPGPAMLTLCAFLFPVSAAPPCIALLGFHQEHLCASPGHHPSRRRLPTFSGFKCVVDNAFYPLDPANNKGPSGTYSNRISSWHKHVAKLGAYRMHFLQQRAGHRDHQVSFL